MKGIHYQPVNVQGDPEGLAVDLYLVGGKVDVSDVDAKTRESWEIFGLADELRMGRVYPKDGERFLEALLRVNAQFGFFDPIN